MGLTSLDSALSGLKINQRQIDIVSANIANVGTDGYTRKILPQSSQVVEGRSIGVMPETIIRNVDIRVQRDLWTQVSSVNFYSVQESYLNRINEFHGDPAAEISVAAEISQLQDKFSALANAPDDTFLLTDVVNQAVDLTQKINDLSKYITTFRNDAQSEASVVIDQINDILTNISKLNAEVRFASISGRSTAAIEDSRDQAVKELSALIDISTYRRGDGVLVVQTRKGVELASETPKTLSFRPTPLMPSSVYPDSAAGIYVGDPAESPGAINITEGALGGKLGGLISMRDYSFPKQMAQLDELAHKMALRFDAQGLRLFTDGTGNIPADTPPDLSVDPPIPVTYIGFSSEITVSKIVLNDHTLIQRGTYNGSVATGATDVVRRVIQYAFGDVEYQLAANPNAADSVDLRAAATGGTTLQEWLGLRSENTLSSNVGLGNYASIADIITAGGDTVFGTGANETDTFILRFDDPDIGGGPYDVTIDLRSVAVSGGGAAQDLVDHIMADANWANIVADFGASVSVGTNGQLVIDSRSNIEITTTGAPEPMSTTGFAFLGLGPGVSQAQDPYFDVQVGNAAAVRITIDPGDTEVELLAKLNAVDGLAAQIDADGFLSLRAGNDFADPEFGGDVRIVGGAFKTSGATLAGTLAGRASLDDGANIVSALFGTYTVVSPGVAEGYSPLTDIEYASETFAGSGVFVGFRNQYLGTNAEITMEIPNATTIKDLSQKMINELAQELNLVKQRGEDEVMLQDLLNQRFLDDSAVNIDEELGYLIVIQTAYAAATRVISAIDESFRELLSAI